jgi:hypothetical protein
MLRDGATTCLEAWGVEQKWNTSLCHPWSSSPIYFYFCRILGIDLRAQGEKCIRITPHLPNDLKFLTLEMPTPHGRIRAEFSREGGIPRYTLTAPQDAQILFGGDGIEFIRK